MVLLIVGEYVVALFLKSTYRKIGAFFLVKIETPWSYYVIKGFLFYRDFNVGSTDCKSALLVRE